MKRMTMTRAVVVALLLGLALSALWGLWSLRRQQELASGVIRLHVIAASDAAADQRLKLQVRDTVLAETTAWLDGAQTREEAQRRLQLHLSDVCTAAADTLRAADCGDEVRAVLSPETYPTRDYGTFALPGGEYLSLRVIIGEGQGHNWWCVVYPPLCTATVTAELEDAAQACGMEASDVALMERASRPYQIQFKSIELWQRWTGQSKK